MSDPIKRLAIAAALAVATATPAHAADSAPALAVRAILSPYANPATEPPAAWNRRVFSQPVAALIARWKQVRPDEEPDALSDGDWFCQCQDWDVRAFRITRITTANLTATRAEVSVSFNLSTTETRAARYVMKRESGRWVLDDLFDRSTPKGLQAALRETIAEDVALRRASGE
jgi:hypothetical protein